MQRKLITQSLFLASIATLLQTAPSPAQVFFYRTGPQGGYPGTGYSYGGYGSYGGGYSGGVGGYYGGVGGYYGGVGGYQGFGGYGNAAVGGGWQYGPTGYSVRTGTGSYGTSSHNLPPNFRAGAYSAQTMGQFGLPHDPSHYNQGGTANVAGYPSTAYPAATSIAGNYCAPAQVHVHVPTADAEIWCQGVKLQTTGTVRHFVSPPLKGDGPFPYEIRACWNSGGQLHTQTKKIFVRPGNNQTVVFAE